MTVIDSADDWLPSYWVVSRLLRFPFEHHYSQPDDVDLGRHVEAVNNSPTQVEQRRTRPQMLSKRGRR